MGASRQGYEISLPKPLQKFIDGEDSDEMASNFYIGQRLSYYSVPCTVRYIGPVAGTKDDWLGVEWDYPSRGKHDGEHKGVKYFDSKIPSSNLLSVAY